MIMNELFDLYVKECLPEVTPQVQRDYSNMINNFLRPEFGERKVHKVKPKHVARFLAVGTGKVHRNRMVMILSSMFKRAQGSWLIDEDIANPCIPVRRHKTEPRERYITHEEFIAFRATCPNSIQLAMDLAYLTGQRQGDIIGMKWKQVITDGPRDEWVIHIDQGKTGKKLAIKISESVEAVLCRAMRAGDRLLLSSDHVIRTKHGKRYTAGGFRSLWQVYMRLWMKAGNQNFHYHDIRAKCVSDTKSLQDASLRAGHADPRITSRVYDRNRRTVEALI